MVKDRYPESHVFYRVLDRELPRIVSGRGCWLKASDGRAFLDGSSGAFAATLGHGLKEMGRALAAQMDKIAYVNGTAFTSQPAEALAAALTKLAPPGLDKAYFLSSGSEAVEAALKLARQYWVDAGKPKKHKIIARSPGYHGNTLLALSASARPHYRKLYGSWLVDVPMIAAPYAYRCGCQGAAACPSCSGEALEQAIIKEGPETVAAFIAEPIGGSSTGASVPRPDYYKTIRSICDRHEVLFIADEVLCGAGRTGQWLALQHYAGVAPDIITMGKGISGGYVPLSAVITGRKLLDVVARKSGALKHAQTFSHVPSICAVGLAALAYIHKHDLIARAEKTGKILHRKLQALKDLPTVGDVRGIGMLAGVEFVAEKASKRPFPRRTLFAETFISQAQHAGLVLWPNVGQADGENGDLAMVAPPFIISESEIDELVAKFKNALLKTVDLLSIKGESR